MIIYVAKNNRQARSIIDWLIKTQVLAELKITVELYNVANYIVTETRINQTDTEFIRGVITGYLKGCYYADK